MGSPGSSGWEELAAPRAPKEASALPVSEVSAAVPVVWGVFSWWCLELSNTTGVVVFVRWVCSEPLVVQSLAGMKGVAGLEIRG